MVATGVYWGSFDPPTLAHKAIIEKSLEYVDKLIIVINNDSRKNYFAPVKLRAKWLKNTCSAVAGKLEYYIQDNRVRYDYNYLKQQYSGLLYAVAGEDSYTHWLANSNVSHIHQFDGIYIVPREQGINFSRISMHNVCIINIAAGLSSISSKRIRENIFNGCGTYGHLKVDAVVAEDIFNYYQDYVNKPEKLV